MHHRCFSISRLLAAALLLSVASIPAPVLAADDAPRQVDVFVAGQDGFHTYRIPALIVSKRGTLLAFCEGRKNDRRDHGDIDLVLRRSLDGGRTWEPMQTVYEEGGIKRITIGNPCPVVDRTTGTIWLSFCRDNDRVFMAHSDDDGVTWAKPVEITAAVKKPDWTWYATGPGHGIQLERGPHRGRLIMPCDHRVEGATDPKKTRHSHVIYSDDHGETWQLGGITDFGMNECEVVELDDSRLLLSMRNYFGHQRRAFAHSEDGGLTWSQPVHEPAVYCPICQSSIVRYTLESAQGRNRLLYAGPGGPARNNLTLRLSYDEGGSWPVARTLHEGPSAYSDLAILPDNSIGVLYESGDDHSYERITFADATLGWLSEGEDALAN